MKKLAEQNNKNSPNEYNRIFHDRAQKGPNWQDIRRWKELLRCYGGGILFDLGCLDSQISQLIKRYTQNAKGYYVGVDVASEAIKIMNQTVGINEHYIVGDLYRAESFGYYVQAKVENNADYVVLGEVLEHLERPADAIKEAFRILKPNGILAISVPLEEANEPGACDADRHLWSYTEQDIKDLVTPYSTKVKTKVLRSKWLPYRYCWPQLVVWCWKK